MEFTKTEKILISGLLFFFFAAIAVRFSVKLADLQTPVWTVDLSFLSALMLCLKADGTAGKIDPVLTHLATEVGTTLQPYAQQYIPYLGIPGVPFNPGAGQFPPNGNISYSATSAVPNGPAATFVPAADPLQPQV